MRHVLIIAILLFVRLSVMAQKDTTAILDAVVRLEKALVNKDSATLNALLHKDVAFGHSSGWVQTKKDVVNDMISGFLAYDKIQDNSVLIDVNKEKAIVKEKISVSGIRDGKAFGLDLFVMEVWLQNKKGWQLYARQSTKL
ncbi:MAG: nuclear transport factor 2 family protein [Chitinophagaceae bacterium]|nr:nuclear transport factor 2 family protein [Chitinophagaceae bacterium]